MLKIGDASQLLIACMVAPLLLSCSLLILDRCIFPAVKSIKGNAKRLDNH